MEAQDVWNWRWLAALGFLSLVACGGGGGTVPDGRPCDDGGEGGVMIDGVCL